MSIQSLLIEHEYEIIAQIKDNDIFLFLPERKEFPVFNEEVIIYKIEDGKISVTRLDGPSEIEVQNYAVQQIIFSSIMKQCLLRHYNPQLILWQNKSGEVTVDEFFSDLLGQLKPEEKEKHHKLEKLMYDFFTHGKEMEELDKIAQDEGIDLEFSFCINIILFKDED
jgi:hypothetical protein